MAFHSIVRWTSSESLHLCSKVQRQLSHYALNRYDNCTVKVCFLIRYTWLFTNPNKVDIFGIGLSGSC